MDESTFRKIGILCICIVCIVASVHFLLDDVKDLKEDSKWSNDLDKLTNQGGTINYGNNSSFTIPDTTDTEVPPTTWSYTYKSNDYSRNRPYDISGTYDYHTQLKDNAITITYKSWYSSSDGGKEVSRTSSGYSTIITYEETFKTTYTEHQMTIPFDSINTITTTKKLTSA